jgi:hypothetical protein
MINIEKRYAYAIIGLLVLSAGIFIVNALTPGVAPNPGHLIDSVAPPSGCGDGQVLQFIDITNGWGCVDMSMACSTCDPYFINVGETGDSIANDTIDDSELENYVEGAQSRCNNTFRYLRGDGSCFTATDIISEINCPCGTCWETQGYFYPVSDPYCLEEMYYMTCMPDGWKQTSPVICTVEAPGSP